MLKNKSKNKPAKYICRINFEAAYINNQNHFKNLFCFGSLYQEDKESSV